MSAAAADASCDDGHPGGCPYQESWEPDLANRIRSLVEKKQDENHNKFAHGGGGGGVEEQQNPLCMVALCGVPGSGKTMSSLLLANILQNQQGIETMIMSHDGYHYPLEYLRNNFPDAKDAIYRRGAPETFDAQALLRDLRRIKVGETTTSTMEALITLPGFDHSKGDPEPDVHTFDRTRHQVVICEGLYLLHDGDGWEQVASTFDLTIFINANVDDCIERLKIRNQCIPGYTPQEICERCETVDRANAMIVVKSKSRANVIVESITTTTTTTKPAVLQKEE